MPNYTQAVTIISSLLLTFVFNLNSFSDKKDFQIRDTILDLVIYPSAVDSACSTSPSPAIEDQGEKQL